MAQASDAPALLAKMEREGFPPMDPNEFRKAYDIMIKVGAGVLPRPVLTETMIDPATGQPTGPVSAAEWGIAAASQMLNDDDPLKPPNFVYRVNKVWPIALERDYRKYRDELGKTMSVALLATVAQVPFSLRTTPKALRAAFAAEFKRQRSRLGDEMVTLVEIPRDGLRPAGTKDHYELEPQPGVIAGTYVPLTLAEYRKAYSLMMEVVAGVVEAPPVQGDEIASIDSGKPIVLEDAPINRGWIAGARSLNDDSKATSFAARMLRVFPIVQRPEYEEHRTDSMTIHIALIAAMASVQFNARTSEYDLRRAFAAEAKKQFGRVDELMAEAMQEPDFQNQPFVTKH